MRSMNWSERAARMGRRGMHIGYQLENQKKTLLGRSRRRWEDDIKMGLGEIEWIGMD
jgi:hypothetical protein